MVANKHAPAKSPTDFVNPNADSAKADAHCAIDISDAPAQIIRMIAAAKIGFFSKRRINESLSIRDRYMGYTSALAENNIEVNLDYVCVDLDDKYNMLNETEAARYDSLRAYIAEIIGQMRAEGVTCILCQNDWVAVELYSVCEELGISVPDDMCIMGFDNMDELNNMHGGDKIITVEQDFYEIGVRAGETILKEIRGEEKGIRDVVPVKLITRDY